MKQLPIESIGTNSERVTFACPGRQQFVVLPHDVQLLKIVSRRQQQCVATDVQGFTVYLHPMWIARLKKWAVETLEKWDAELQQRPV